MSSPTLLHLIISEWILVVIQDPILCLGRDVADTCVLHVYVDIMLMKRVRLIFLLSTCFVQEDLALIAKLMVGYLGNLAARYRSVRRLRGIRVIKPQVS